MQTLVDQEAVSRSNIAAVLAAQTTLRCDQGPFFALHVPETPSTHARLPQSSLLSPVWYTVPSGHVQDPPCPPTPGAFSETSFVDRTATLEEHTTLRVWPHDPTRVLSVRVAVICVSLYVNSHVSR